MRASLIGFAVTIGGALATVDTPVQYLDTPQFVRFFDSDAKNLAAAVQRVGKVE